jgi:hypothetical protein
MHPLPSMGVVLNVYLFDSFNELDLLALSKYRCNVPRAVAAKKKSFLVKSTAPRVVSPLHEEIADRAYQIYLQRGSIHGWDLDDWLQAERELLKESKKKPGRPKKSDLAALAVQ